MQTASSDQTVRRRRPLGITVIAVLWSVVSLVRIYLGVQTLIVDFSLLPYLSSLFDPSAPEWSYYSTHEREWISYGLPAETLISLLIVALCLLAVLTAYGLFTAKRWSYKFSFIVPALAAIVDLAAGALYAVAPAEQGIIAEFARARTTLFLSLAVVNLILLMIIVIYARKPDIKQYIIGSQPSPTPESRARKPKGNVTNPLRHKIIR